MSPRTITSWLTVGLAVVTLTGCKDAPPAEIRYEPREIRVVDGTCGDESKGPCARFTAEYPVFFGGRPDDTAGVDAINDAILQMLVEPERRDATAGVLDSMAREFIDAWIEIRKEFPDAATTAGWFSERRMDVIHRSRHLVTVRLEWSEYSGGAHPNSTVSYASFALPEGRRLDLRDLMIDGFESNLDGIAETVFRRDRAIPAGADLGIAGFWFENDRFAVNDNFAVLPGVVRFHFDPYEIAPYAVGPIEIEIGVAELRPVLRPEVRDWFRPD